MEDEFDSLLRGLDGEDTKKTAGVLDDVELRRNGEIVVNSRGER